MQNEVSRHFRKIGLSRSEAAFRLGKNENKISPYNCDHVSVRDHFNNNSSRNKNNSISNANYRIPAYQSVYSPKPPTSGRPKVTVVSPTRKAKVPITSLDDLRHHRPVITTQHGLKEKQLDELCAKLNAVKVERSYNNRLEASGSESDECDGEDDDEDDDDDDEDDDDDGVDDDVDDGAENDDNEDDGLNDYDKGISSNDGDDEDLDDDIYEEVTDSSDGEDEEEDDKVSSTPSSRSRGDLQTRTSSFGFSVSGNVRNYPLVESLFPGKPPTLYFTIEEEKVVPLPLDMRRILRWKSSTVTPKVVKACVQRTGFRLLKTNNDWLGTWGKHMKPTNFKTLKEFQKINHFPGTFVIGRKDKLWRNFVKMRTLHGRKEWNFMPQTYVLPHDMKTLRKAWDENTKANKNKWIIKPPASARGIGIRVVHKWSQIPKKRPVVVQRYLAKPCIINSRKFDLRIYVFVGGYDPLRVYIFQDGLVRFATSVYSASSKSLSNKYMHLTNYSVNKKNKEYKNKESGDQDSFKWSLKALWKYLEGRGVNTKKIWETIKDISVKAVLAGESPVSTMLKQNTRTRYSCYELFGLDIILDHRFKPWLLEVNISPSLHSQSQLDLTIKGQLVKDILNMVGFHLPKSLLYSLAGRTSLVESIGADSFWFEQRSLTVDEKAKHTYFLQRHNDIAVRNTILDVLTNDDALILMSVEDEYCRSGSFDRIFPPCHSKNYLPMFEVPKYYDILLRAWIGQYSTSTTQASIGIARLQAIASTDIQPRATDKTLTKHKWSHVRQNFPRSKSVPPKKRDSSVASGSSLIAIEKQSHGRRRKDQDSFFVQRNPKPKISVNCILRKESTVADSKRSSGNQKEKINVVIPKGRTMSNSAHPIRKNTKDSPPDHHKKTSGRNNVKYVESMVSKTAEMKVK